MKQIKLSVQFISDSMQIASIMQNRNVTVLQWTLTNM